jgi:hypothetical protein
MHVAATLAMILAVGFLVLLAAFVSTTAQPVMIMGFVSVIAAVPLLLKPKYLVYGLLALSMLISGLLETFVGMAQANWIPSGVGLALWVALFVRYALTSKLNTTTAIESDSIAWVVAPLALYIFSFCASAMLNAAPVPQVIVGIRNYVPFISIAIAFSGSLLSSKDRRTLLMLVMVIGASQFLFCIAEQLIIVPRRRAFLGPISGEAEAIVGSFGGNPMFGGYTGEMAVFVMCCALAAIYLPHKYLSFQKIIAPTCLVSLLISVGLAETKIVFVLLPALVFAIALLYPEPIEPRVKSGLLYATLAFTVLAVVYYFRYWAVSDGEFFHAFTYSFDSDFMVSEKERGRFGSMVYWWDMSTTRGGIPEFLFGYGPGASISSSAVAGAGLAVKLYGEGLDNNALTKLLWDFGLIGAISFVLVYFGSFALIIRNRINKSIPLDDRKLLAVLGGWLLALAAMVPYQVSVIGCGAMQFFLWFTVGFILHITCQPRVAQPSHLYGR